MIMVMMTLLARMGMDDEEVVALIGGGHGVGKAHGACPLGAGPGPSEDPFNPWPGRCGAGKLEEAFTSGLELPWTTRPTSWDNEFFSNLLDYEWELHQVNTRASNQGWLKTLTSAFTYKTLLRHYVKQVLTHGN